MSKLSRHIKLNNFIVLFMMLVIIFTISFFGNISNADQFNRYVVNVVNDGSSEQVANEHLMIERKILSNESTDRELVFETNVKNVTETKPNVEVAIVVDTSYSVDENGSFRVLRNKAIELVSKLTQNTSNLRISLTTTDGVQVVMGTNYDIISSKISGLVVGTGTSLQDGLNYAMSTLSMTSSTTERYMAVFTDATDKVSSQLQSINQNGTNVFSIISGNIDSSEFGTEQNPVVGNLYNIDTLDCSQISNIINKAINNIQVNDVLSDIINNCFDFEIVSFDNNIGNVAKTTNGYQWTINQLMVNSTVKMKWKLKMKDDSTITDRINTVDAIYRDINTNTSIDASYTTLSGENGNVQGIISPVIQICETYSLKIKAVNTENHDMPVQSLRFQVIGKDIDGNTVYSKTLSSDSRGMITFGNIKTLGQVTFSIKPLVNQVGYSQTDEIEVVVNNSYLSTGLTVSTELEYSIDTANREINLTIPIAVEKFAIQVELSELNNSINKLEGVEFRLIQPKINNKFEMDVLTGSTDEEGVVTFRSAVMTEPDYYDYILTQMSTVEGYEEIGNVIIRVWFNSAGEVTKVEKKYNDNVTVEMASDTVIKASVANKSQLSSTFKFDIALLDAQDNTRKISNSRYQVEVSRTGQSGQIISTYIGETDYTGVASLTLPGSGLVGLTITEIKPNDLYVPDLVKKSIWLNISNASIQSIMYKEPVDLDVNIDFDDPNKAVLHLQSTMKSEQNVLKVCVTDMDEKDATISNIKMNLIDEDTEEIYDSLTVCSGNDGVLEFALPLIYNGEQYKTYKLEFDEESLPKGYNLPVVTSRILIRYDTEGKIAEVSDLDNGQGSIYKTESTVIMNENNAMYSGIVYFGMQVAQEYIHYLELNAAIPANHKFTDSVPIPIENVKYNITIQSNGMTREIKARATNELGQIRTRLLDIGESTLIEITQVEIPIGYKLDSTTQEIIVKNTNEQLIVESQTPYSTATVDGANVVYNHDICKKGAEDVRMNLHLNVIDTDENYVANQTLKIYAPEILATQGTYTGHNENLIYDSDGIMLNKTLTTGSDNGLFGDGEIYLENIKLDGINIPEEKDYILHIVELDVDGKEIPETLIKVKLTFRFNENLEEIQLTNTEVIWGNRLVKERTFNATQNEEYYLSNAFLTIYHEYDSVGNFSLDLAQINDNEETIYGAKYDVIVTRPDGTKVIRKAIDIADRIELTGLLVSEGTTIELTEVKNPIGYESVGFTRIINITRVDSDTGEVFAEVEDGDTKSIARTITLATTDVSVLDNGTIKTRMKATLKSYILDTFKIGIVTKDSVSGKYLAGNVFSITTSKNALKDTKGTYWKNGYVATAVGGKYENQVVTYDIDKTVTTTYYKDDMPSIKLLVPFNANQEIDSLIVSSQTDPNYGDKWKIIRTNTLGGNDIDLEILIDPLDSLNVNLETVDTTNQKTLDDVEYKITPSLNLPATGTTNIPVGYVGKNVVETYTIQQTSQVNNYNVMGEQKIQIIYDSEGNISDAIELTDNIEIKSFNGKDINIKLNAEPKNSFVITNKGYFDNALLQNAEFEVIQENCETGYSDVTNSSGNVILYNGKFETNNVTYTIKQKTAVKGYGRVEDFDIKVHYNQNREIIAVERLTGDSNLVDVSVKQSSVEGDIGYNGNNKGIVNILVKNYPAFTINLTNVDGTNGDTVLDGSIFDVTSTINTEARDMQTDEEGKASIYLDKTLKDGTVIYTIIQKSIKTGYQSFANDVKIEVKFDARGYILGTPTLLLGEKNAEVTTLDTNANPENNFVIDLKIKNYPALKLNIVNNDRLQGNQLGGAEYEITSTLNNDVDKFQMTTDAVTSKYLRQGTLGDHVTYTIKETKTAVGYRSLASEIVMDVYLNLDGTVGTVTILQGGTFIIADKVANPETFEDNYVINIEIKSNKIFTLKMINVNQNNTPVRDATFEAKVLIMPEGTENYKIEGSTNGNGDLTLLLDKYADAGNTNYVIRQTKKTLGYEWLDESIAIRATYDSNGMLQEDSVELGTANEFASIESVDVSNNTVILKVINKEVEDFGVSINVCDAYDNTKKLQTGTYNVFLTKAHASAYSDGLVTDHSCTSDGKHEAIMETGKDRDNDGNPDVGYGEDYVALGKYDNIASDRIVRIVPMQTPDSYYKGNTKTLSDYESINYPILIGLHFDEEGRITNSWLNTGNYESWIGSYLADGRYIEVSNSDYNISVTIKHHPLLNVKVTANNKYTKDILNASYRLSTQDLAAKFRSISEYNSIGYINKAFMISTEYGSAWIQGYAFNENLDSGETVKMGEIEGNEVSRIVYLYETSAPEDYQKYGKRNSKDDGERKIAKIRVTYNAQGEIDKYELLEQYSDTNITNTINLGLDGNRCLTADVEYAPRTTFVTTAVDQVSKQVLPNVEITPFINEDSENAKYAYDGLQTSYMTDTNGIANIDYWGANVNYSNNRYTMKANFTGEDYGYLNTEDIDVDVTYDNSGNVSSAQVVSVDKYGDYEAQVTGWEGNKVYVEILCKRLFKLKIDTVNGYDKTKQLTAEYKVVSEKGASADLISYQEGSAGIVYAGKTIKYQLSETTNANGYVSMEALEFNVKFRENGTIEKAWSDSKIFDVIAMADESDTIRRNNVIDLEIQISLKPRFCLDLELKDKFYDNSLLKGGIFNITNSKGDNAVGTLETDENGYISTYVGPTYPNEEVTYTIVQENVITGYNKNEEEIKFKVKFNSNGNIEEYYIIEGNNIAYISPEDYQNTTLIKVEVKNIPTDMKLGINTYDDLTQLPIAGIKYKVTREDAENSTKTDIDLISNADGTAIDIVDKYTTRTQPKLMKYTISEMEVPNTYRKIEDVVVQVKFDVDGKIISRNVLSNPSKVDVDVSTGDEVQQLNGENVAILLTIPNDNTYDLKIKNEDSNYKGLGVFGTKYNLTVNGEMREILDTDENGISELIDQTDSGDLLFRISENTIGEGYRADTINDVSFEINKGLDIYSLILNEDATNSFNEIESKETVGENHYIYTIKPNDTTTKRILLEIDEGLGNINVIFKNETKFEVAISKTDISTNQPLQNAQFEIWAQEVNAYFENIGEATCITTGIENNLTDVDGKLTFDLGITPQNKTIKYILKEVVPPEGYNKLKDIEIVVKYDMYGKINPETSVVENSYMVDAYMDTDTGYSLKLDLDVKNGNAKPNFDMKIINLDSKTNNRINGSKFSIEAVGVGTEEGIIDRVEKESDNTYKTLTTKVQDELGVIQTRTKEVVKEKGVIEFKDIDFKGSMKVKIEELNPAVSYEIGDNIVSGEFFLTTEAVMQEDGEVALNITLDNNESNLDIVVDSSNREVIVRVKNNPVTNFAINVVDKLDVQEDEVATNVQGAKFSITSEIYNNAETQPTELNNISDVTDENGKVNLNAGSPYAGQTVVYTLRQEAVPDEYDAASDIILMVQYDTKGFVKYYEILSDSDSARVESTYEDNRVIGGSCIPLTIRNEKIVGIKPYKVELSAIDFDNRDFVIPGAKYQITVEEEFGNPSTTWEQSTDMNGKIVSEFFNGYGRIKIIIKQLSLPDGYKIDNEDKIFEFKKTQENGEAEIIINKTIDGSMYSSDDEERVIRLISYPGRSERVYSFLINNMDANTNRLITNNPSMFKISKLKNDGTNNLQPMESKYTNNNGVLKFNNIEIPLEEGIYTYQIEQIENPRKYIKLEKPLYLKIETTLKDGESIVSTAKLILDDGTEENVIINGRSLIMQIANKAEDRIGTYSMNLTKVNADTQEVINDEEVVYKLINPDNIALYSEVITNEDGRIEKFYTENGSENEVDLTKLKMPTAEQITNSQVFKLIEIKAPTGYVLDSTENTITIHFGYNEQNKIVITGAEVQGNAIMVGFEDEQINIKMPNKKWTGGSNPGGDTPEEPITLSSTSYNIGLLTEPYVEGTNSEYEEGDKYILGIEPLIGIGNQDYNRGTSISKFKQNITTNADNVEIFDAENNVVSDEEALVGSGMKLKLTKGTLSLEMILIVKADPDGDGIFGDGENVKMRRYLAETETTPYFDTEIKLLTLDVDLSGDIQDNDFVKTSLAIKNDDCTRMK